MTFVADKPDIFQPNSSLNCINTRHNDKLHIPRVNLSCIQKGVTYSALKIVNSLPLDISRLKNDKLHFKMALRRYLITHAFYSHEDFFSHSQKPIQ